MKHLVATASTSKAFSFPLLRFLLLLLLLLLLPLLSTHTPLLLLIQIKGNPPVDG